jgi:pentatricopeptide repeat domain-containing protein 1
MNMQILGAMMRQGCVRKNFDYVLEILNIIREGRLRPSEQLLLNLDKFVKRCKKMTHMPDQLPSFKKEVYIFLQKLNNWKDFMGLKDLKVEEAVKKVRDHPWDQFRNTQKEGFEEEKNKKLKHKKKIERYIKRIKVDQLESDEPKASKQIDN